MWVAIVQQCQMLESELNSDVLAMCLKNTQEAPAKINNMKWDILKSKFEALLSSACNHPSAAKLVATVAETTYTSWCQLWDIALNHGV